MPKPQKGLTQEQQEFVNAVEQVYQSTGRLPTTDALVSMTSLEPLFVQRCWNNYVVRNQLMLRGIDLNPTASNKVLSTRQLQLVNLLLNIYDKRSVKAKLQECRVSEREYQGWLRDTRFREYLTHRSEELFKTSDHEAYTALIDVVRGGDVSGLKLFFEMRGIYTPKVDVQINVEQILLRVVEVISRHVPPHMLDAIAVDLEAIDLGTPARRSFLPPPPQPSGPETSGPADFSLL